MADIRKILKALEDSESFIEKEKGHFRSGDTYQIKVNKESPYYELVRKIQKVCNKSLEEIKLITQKGDLQLFEGRTAVFRDLKLFIADKGNVKMVSPMQAIQLLVGDDKEKICTIKTFPNSSAEQSDCDYTMNILFE